MPTKRKQFCCGSSEAGFSLIELCLVVAILMIAAAIAVPNIAAVLNGVKLRGATQQVAELYQQARMKAVEDDSYYEVLISANAAQAYVDTGGDGRIGTLVAQMPAAILVSNQGVPALLDQKTLGFNPITTESSTMFDLDGTNRPGLAWSSRGFPCQRTSPTSLCQPGIGWVQYVQSSLGTQSAYAAVSVSPAGRVRVWTYTGGVWR